MGTKIAFLISTSLGLTSAGSMIAATAVPGPGSVTLSSVQVHPRRIRPGGRIRISFMVRSQGARAAETQGPPPGTLYQQGQGWQARGFAPIPGRVRVGVALSGPRGRQTLYRWGLGRPLRPLEFRRVNGYLRLRQPGQYTLYPAVIREGDGEQSYPSVGLVTVTGRRGRHRTVASRILVDGKEVGADVPPKLIGATIMVPLRFIAEGLGAGVVWQPRRKRVVIRRGGETVTTRVGSHALRHNGRSETIYQPARIIRGRIFVPLRAVGYALGVGVEWDGPTRTVLIHTHTRPGPVGPT
jgi:hypothetical protein